MFIESVMSSNHLILCCPLLLLPSIFPNIRVFSNESALHIGWLKYWSFSFQWIFVQDWFPLGSPCSSRNSQESSPTPQFKSINSSVLSFLYCPTLTSIHYFVNKRSSSESYCFSSSHVWMWGLDYKKKLSTEELMLLNCDVGEDSWESLGLQGDPTTTS